LELNQWHGKNNFRKKTVEEREMIHFPLNNVELEYKLRDELFQQMENSKMILSNISDLKNYSFNIIKDINKFN